MRYILAIVLGGAAVQAAAAAVVGDRESRPRLTISLSGTDWHIHDDATGTGARDGLFAADPAAPGWIQATVPGNVQADLEAARLLKPNSYGAGDPQLAEVARKDWWYRKDVTIPPSVAGQRLTLVFDGVDQESEVWLNGQSLGTNNGMFRRFWFDATSAAKPGAVNQLAVRIAKRSPQPQDRIPLQSRTNLGYDWGTPVSPMGIWKDVRLEATGPARIVWTRVQTALSDDHARATVTATLDIDSTTDLPAKAVFQITGQGQTATVTVDAPLHTGHNVVRGELTLERPAIWWPAGHGGQPLYTLAVDLQPNVGGEPLDVRTTRFGVRDIRWVHTEGAPENHVSRYQLIINGRPIRTIGTNFIPADLLFGRMTPRAEFLFRQAREAGMNTLRLWGGGVILHESLYDLADELGLLLVQDFPLANFVPPTDDTYLAMLDSTARNIVRQVRNHPSIMEFDGGNEMRWRSDTPQPHVDVMRKVVAEEDGRMFRATCPDVGATHGPWECHRKWYRPLNELNTDTVVGGTPQILRPTMRSGEFGSHSPASIEIWQREFPPDVQWPIIGLENEILHRKRAVRAIGPYNWLYKNIVEDVFGPAESLEEFITAGQFFGADGLRYMLDAMRRGGRRIGGMTSWMLNEPWPNGAGSYLVDYDGRPKLMYDLYKQALAPISLSLKYDLPYYSVDTGMHVEAFLVSDAPQETQNLRWRLVARDRRGTVFFEREGIASITPLEVKSLGAMQIMPPAQTIFGPMFVELRLDDGSGRLLTERMHVFGCNDVATPLARLLRTDSADPDDDLSQLTARAQRPTNDRNLVLHMLPTGMTPVPKTRRPWGFETRNITDGEYGSDQGWSDGWFEVKLRRKATLGSFRFGRDRTGAVQDPCIDFMKIEASLDGQTWQTVFERDGLTKLPGFSPAKTVEIRIPPVEAEHLRVTLLPTGSDGKGPFPALDEFEAYAAEVGQSADGSGVTVLDRPELWRPMRRTTLEVTASPQRLEGKQQVLELTVKNTGPMTAFPCEVHPLVSYRTDLFIDNNHCFIPPGESRTITIRADIQAPCGLTLAQTGWWISAWNADQVTIAPSDEVLLSVGRRDGMCREFAGASLPATVPAARSATMAGTRLAPARMPFRLEGGQTARFEFPAGEAAATRPARLRLHTADQSNDIRAVVLVKVNGRSFEQSLPHGLGIQITDPAHLAYPATAEFVLPAGTLRNGNNSVDVQVTNAGWFTWDSLECVAEEE